MSDIKEKVIKSMVFDEKSEGIVFDEKPKDILIEEKPESVVGVEEIRKIVADKKPRKVTVRFKGGLEILFPEYMNSPDPANRQLSITLPPKDADGKGANIAYLINDLCENHMEDPRSEVFAVDGVIRAGVFVLINNADWELEGTYDYEFNYEYKEDEEGPDEVVFISTLHGG